MKRYLGTAVVVCALYWLNQELLKPHTTSPFVHNHLNDLLAPILLMSIAGILSHGEDHHRLVTGFAGTSIIILFASFAWEVVTPLLLHRSVGDPLDVLFYIVGGLLFCVINAQRGNIDDKYVPLGSRLPRR